MDATSSRYAEQAWADKLAAGFTNSAGMNGDKLNTLQSFALFAMQHSMVWIGLGLPAGNSTVAGSPEELNRLAGFLGAMAQSPADAGPDVAPAGSDLRTAAHSGPPGRAGGRALAGRSSGPGPGGGVVSLPYAADSAAALARGAPAVGALLRRPVRQRRRCAGRGVPPRRRVRHRHRRVR